MDSVKKVNEDGEIVPNEKSIADAVRRAKCAVVDYALNNDFTHFGTITINDKWHDVYTRQGQLDILDKLLDCFDNYRQTISEDFRYIICPEYGETTGRLHFHFLVKGIDKEDLFINYNKHLDWLYVKSRFGHVQITKIGKSHNDHQRVAFYCSKYITKDNLQLRSHRYFCSKDLKKPERFCMDLFEYTVMFKEWLEENYPYPYHVDKVKKIESYSLPVRVFYDMLEKCGVLCSRKHGVVIYESFDTFYADNPFESGVA